MKKRIVYALLLGMMTWCFSPVCTLAETENKEIPGYYITGQMNDETGQFDARIMIRNINALCGTFALDYDQTKLDLVTNGELSGTVIAPSEVVVTTEGRDPSAMISQTEGYVLIGWYPSSTRLNALSEDRLIGTVSFRLKEGTTADDFDSRTIYLRNKMNSQVLWNTGAWLRAEGLVDYKHNVEGVFECSVVFDYPGCTIIPAEAWGSEFKVSGTGGEPLSAEITIGIDKYTVDETGSLSLKLPNGSYTYKVSREGYESKFGGFIVDGKGITEKVTLRTNKQLVADVAESIEIEYAKGDSANRVTQAIGLPTSGADSTRITWTSSDLGAITENGSVFSGRTDVTVKLTATVSKDGETAQKEFTVNVIAGTGSGTLHPTDPETTPAPTQAPDTGEETKFLDLENVGWAAEAIETLAREGIIKGTSETMFSPDESIKRGDFIALLMRMIPVEGKSSEDFSDVSKNSYYYKEIMLAKSLGIANGQGDNQFCPEDSITREDMMALTYRTLILKEYLADAEMSDVLNGFSDKSEISSYALKPMSALVSNKLIMGSPDGMIHPAQNTTRAETAVFLFRIFINYL